MSPPEQLEVARACAPGGRPGPRPGRRRGRSMKSQSVVASGAMTRSTDECEMSRSCHSAMSSSAAPAYARRRRARPHRFSDRMGFFLCGMARGALLALAEGLLGLAHLGALPVAHGAARCARPPAPTQRQGGEDLGVAVARDDLGGDRLGLQAQRGQRPRLHRGRQVARRCRRRRRSCRPAMSSRARLQPPGRARRTSA